MTDKPLKPRTVAAQALGAIEPETKGVALPVHVSTTFIRDPDNQYRTGYIYGRTDNATVRQTEAVIAALEGAHEALMFGSGMAAATSVVLALPPGSHVLAPQVCYWGLRDWLINEAPLFGYRVDLVDMSSLDAVRTAMQPDTKLVWIETPSNPLWGITDIAAVAEIAHAAAAVLAIDSTTATPVFARPLSLGADIVMHSATKYRNGHSDVIAGALAAARENELWTRIKQVRAHHGAILGPFEAWLVLRGLRTLEIRVRAQAENAALLATRFANHQAVSAVPYSRLPSHPRHLGPARQMSGLGRIPSIRLQ